MFRVSEKKQSSQAEGSCIKASSTIKMQSAAKTRARRAPTRTFRESNGASCGLKDKQRDSTASSSDKEDLPPARRRKNLGPKRH